MPQANVFSSKCPSRDVLVHISGKWGALIIAALDSAPHPLRFKDLRASIDGISDRMLSHTLGLLERDGVLVRTEEDHVTYGLSALGHDVAQPLLQLISTVENNMGGILQSNETYDRSH